jgi:hypothetical protein
VPARNIWERKNMHFIYAPIATLKVCKIAGNIGNPIIWSVPEGGLPADACGVELSENGYGIKIYPIYLRDAIFVFFC